MERRASLALAIGLAGSLLYGIVDWIWKWL